MRRTDRLLDLQARQRERQEAYNALTPLEKWQRNSLKVRTKLIGKHPELLEIKEVKKYHANT